MANFCTYCGKPLEKGAKFCIDCGQPVLRERPKKVEPKKEDLINTFYKLYSIVVSEILANMLPKYNDDRVLFIQTLLEGGV